MPEETKGYGPDSKDDDILSDAKEKFKAAQEAESDNRDNALEDIRFARLGQQWPKEIERQRLEEGRPMLTVNRLPSFIRQVVNDARQNKPAIKTRPVDSEADIETAEIFNGIIRHIEANSGADIAYDTAVDNAVSGGFGYWRIGLDYAHDDTFDMELSVEAVPDPFTIYGDPWATSADGRDWNCAFVVERMALEQFEKDYPGAEVAKWSSDEPTMTDWRGKDWMQVAEYWIREESERQIMRLADGNIIDVAMLEDEETLELYRELILPEAQVRSTPTWKVKQCILSDSEVLEKRDWPGKWIPIVPVYGDEVNEEGKRHFRSLIRDAIDPQRQFNYWRTTATELIALAPKTPFLGHAKAFTAAPEKWDTANNRSWPYIEVTDGQEIPQRQQIDATAMGAIGQAMQAQDDMKSVIGIFDAGLGAKGNETSGKAIIARQREGDTSTFHFIDNLTRSIRHSGRILIDLIPHVWPDERIVRLMGEDGTASDQKVNGPVPVMDKNGQPEMEPDPAQMPQPGPDGQMMQPQRPKMRVFSLTAGKYDLTATAGPSYTTKREEAANQMIELVRAFPQAAPFIGDLLVKNLDWPGADEIAERLKAMIPGQQGLPPEIQQAIQEGQKLIQKLEAENEKLKADHAVDMAKVEVERAKLGVEQMKVQAEGSNAQADRQKTQAEAIRAAEQAKAEGRKMDIEEQRLAIEAFKAETARADMGSKTQVEIAAKMKDGKPPNGRTNVFADMPTAINRGPSKVEQEMIMTLERVAQALTAPKRLVKDENGRPVGVELAPEMQSRSVN